MQDNQNLEQQTEQNYEQSSAQDINQNTVESSAQYVVPDIHTIDSNSQITLEQNNITQTSDSAVPLSDTLQNSYVSNAQQYEVNQSNFQEASQFDSQPAYQTAQSNQNVSGRPTSHRSFASSPMYKLFKYARSQYSYIGFTLLLFLIGWQLAASAVSLGFAYLGIDGLLSNTNIAMAISMVTEFVIGVPILYLLLRKIPVAETKQFTMKWTTLLKYYTICYFLIIIGSIIGNLVDQVISQGAAYEEVDSMVGNSSIVVSFIFTVIVAPILEEWIFRKQLLSRLRVFGEVPAIVFSALAFGLFHMNVAQFFYATLLGLVFGYIYTRTSKLRYSVILHMCINFQGGILVSLLGDTVDFTDPESLLSNSNIVLIVLSACVSLLGLIFLVSGAINFWREHKKLVFFKAPKQLPRRLHIMAAYINWGVILFILFTVTGTVGVNLLPMIFQAL
ncbi:MAG: type II CAAX endopeptidase family protein [Bifidobacteriaceae bacterium]|nr:type II CAAX endopeptidase family protein [Bifidobacteriaceae bacterium]